MTWGDKGTFHGKAQKSADSVERVEMKKTIALNDHGRVIGENHPRAKLLDSEVDQLLELVEAGFSLAQAAEKMGISKSCAAHIVSGRRRCQTPARLVVVSVSD